MQIEGTGNKENGDLLARPLKRHGKRRREYVENRNTRKILARGRRRKGENRSAWCIA